MPVTLLACQAMPLPGRETIPWRAVLHQPDAWYASVEARGVAENVLLYQDTTGGWAKNTDMTVAPTSHLSADEPTIDNGATTTQLLFLSQVATAQPQERAIREAVLRGLDYLLAAQYANGGWPQFFPLRRGYYSHITYNDNAMVSVLKVLRAVARAEEPFAWVDDERRQRAARAETLGLQCILDTQVRVEGQLTAWCAQHDAVTLEPAPARAFEPVSLSGAETVGILQFLMGVPDPSAEVVAAIHAGVAWLEAVKLSGWRIERPPLPQGGRDRVLVPDPQGVAWARFYQIRTNRPIFLGRDAIVRYDLREVEAERRVGYSYYGTWAESLLSHEYPAWKAKHEAAQSRSMR